MDAETENLIKFLNSHTNPPHPGRGFRIRQTRTNKSLVNPSKSTKFFNTRPGNRTFNEKSSKTITEKSRTLKPEPPLKKIEAELEEEVILDVLEFYREEDEKYRNEIACKTGAPVLWLRTTEVETKASIKVKKFLCFKPYIDPMTIRPVSSSSSEYFFKMQNSDVKLIRYTLEDNGFKETSNTNWTIMWHGGPLKSNQYQTLTKYQKVNHFPRSHEITRKDLMYKNLAKMQSIHGARVFDFVPKTFIMPQDAGQLEYEMNLMETTWIVKPSASSQGKGIFLTGKFSEVPKKDHVVSQYIDNPLLIDGLKFDLRIYVAITCFNPLRVYMFKEGLARFATQKYNDKSKGSRFMFLTNYSVNKFSENFVENSNALEDDKGSKWSISALRKLFAEQGVNDEKLWAKIKDLVVKTIISIEGIVFSGCEMNLPFRNNCFELLGFDVLIDDTLNPWLLEVNLSPSMNCDAPIDQKIKGELIADLFTLTGVVSVAHRRAKPGATQNKSLNYLAYMEKFTGKNSKRDSRVESAENINNEENAILKETLQEFKRRGGFERIFPAENAASYKGLFERERPYNNILLNQLSKINKKVKEN
jgi:tubulin polyglutamylase TTLL5